jgi:glyoxylase-like metal-dependent hydrolase (beta-lactamase superfamily II)
MADTDTNTDTDWRVKSLIRGELRCDRSIVLPSRPGEDVWIPSTVYYLTDGDQDVLLDTGFADPDLVRERQPAFEPRAERSFETLLREEAVPPAEVDTVVLSHLHWDHAGNADVFGEDTEILVHREAVEYACAPLDIHARAFLSPTAGFEPSWLGPSLTIRDGDHTVAPGLELLETPGHAPGHWSALVEHGDTTHGLAIDVFPLYANLEGSRSSRFAPPGTMDVREWYASAERLVAAADEVVPSHDPEGPGTEWIVG